MDWFTTTPFLLLLLLSSYYFKGGNQKKISCWCIASRLFSRVIFVWLFRSCYKHKMMMMMMCNKRPEKGGFSYIRVYIYLYIFFSVLLFFMAGGQKKKKKKKKFFFHFWQPVITAHKHGEAQVSARLDVWWIVSPPPVYFFCVSFPKKMVII